MCTQELSYISCLVVCMITFMMTKSVCRGLFQNQNKKRKKKMYVMINYYARCWWSQMKNPLICKLALCNSLIFFSSHPTAGILNLREVQLKKDLQDPRTMPGFFPCCPASKPPRMFRCFCRCLSLCLVSG